VAPKGKPYELFGSYLLFKKLESDRFSELWRAGEITNNTIQNTVVVRRFVSGDRELLKQAAEHARSVVAGVSGTTFVKGQKIGFVSGVPYLAHEYNGGRSLRTIVDKARGGTNGTPNPIPLDQSLAITEKLALSLETLSNMRFQGQRLTHGALIPQFVWVSEEGEVRCAGQQLGKALMGAIKQPESAKELGGYLAPELRQAADFTKATDVYSVGAILYLLVTGEEPPEPTGNILGAIQSAKLHGKSDPIPADIRTILEKAMQPDPANRYASASDLRQALDKLLNGGEYSPTTFNLAFYLHSLLKKEMEVETHERQQEASVDVATYLQAAAAPAPVTASHRDLPPIEVPFGSSMLEHHEASKSKMPLVAAIAAVAVLGGVGAYFGLAKGKTTESPSQIAAASTIAPPTAAPKPAPAIEPIVASAPGASTDTSATAATASMDPAAREKAIQDAVNKKLQEEMMKLQDQYNKDLQKQQPQPAARPTVAPRTETPAPVEVAAAKPQPAAPVNTQPEQPAMSAAQLDQLRRAQNPTPAVQTPAPAVAQPQPQEASAPAVQEGDLIAVNSLDQMPELRSPVRPVYPPLALKRRSEATVIVSALISETGKVLDVKVLRGDSSKSGFDEAATRAVRSATFTSPMKDGKRVRTWKPLPIIFKLQ
jgi:TonB family protein